MVYLKCPHCKNEWDYTGTKKVKVNCTDCGKRIEIAKNKCQNKKRV